MRAVRVEVIGPEKYVRPYLKCVRPYWKRVRQNRCELMTKTILLLPKFVLSKMNHESEHFESEFYYPGELSHAELLQSPTHSESKERNLTLLANEETHNFLRNQQANRWRRNSFFQRHQRIHRGSRARKPKK